MSEKRKAFDQSYLEKEIKEKTILEGELKTKS